MNQANLPSQQDLNSLYGSWNPMSYMQGMQNQGLAEQFREQAFNANDIANQTAIQNYDKNQELNPLLIAQQGLVNTGRDLTNQDAALDVGKKSSLFNDTLEQERAKLKEQFSASELMQMSDEIWKDHLDNLKSGDPAKIEETGKLLDLLGGSNKAADRVQKRNLQEGDWLNSQILARIGADSRVASAGTRGGATPPSWQTQYNKLPPATKKDVAASAIATGRNPYTGEELDEDEITQFKASYESAVKTLDANNLARGQGQGITAGVAPDKTITIENKTLPSVSGKPVSKMTDDELINQYLKK